MRVKHRPSPRHFHAAAACAAAALMWLPSSAYAMSPGLVAAFAPRDVRLGHPSLMRAELAATRSAFRAGKHARACEASENLRAKLLAEAADVFYGPERLKVDVPRFERFLDAHVRGNAPLLEVAGEVFVPTSAWRRLTLAACLRAAGVGRTRRVRPGDVPAAHPLEIGLRFGAQAAWLGHDEQLRAAVAAAWLGLGRDPAAVAALVEPARVWKSTASAMLRVVLMAPGSVRDAALAAAAKAALPEEAAFVALVAGHLEAAPAPTKRDAPPARGPAPAPDARADR